MTQSEMGRALMMTAVLVVPALGCGGDVVVEQAESETTVEPSTGQETATTTEPDPPATWDDMNRDQKMAFMQQTVMPEMKALFVEFDAERYADFGCATCHGDDMQEQGFGMPNTLAPLDPANIPAMFQSEEPMAVFMTQKAWPRMAELLQQPLYDPETHEGFGCLKCHATVEGS